MKDDDTILLIISDYEPHYGLEISKRGKPGAINWAYRSRISSMRRQLFPLGYRIDSWIGSNRQGVYQLKKVFDKEGQGMLL